MPEMLSNNLDLPSMLADNLLKTKKEYNTFKQQEIQDTFIRTK